MLKALKTAATLSFVFLANAAFAQGIEIEDTTVYAARPGAPSAAAYMEILNTGETADRLLDAKSEAARRVQLHETRTNAEGLMSMEHLPDGVEIAAGESIRFERGGMHVMFMGLVEPISDGDVLSVTLVFETAGEITLDITVDLTAP